MLKNMFSRIAGFITAAVMAFTLTSAFAANAADSTENDKDELVKQIALMVNKARSELGLNPVYVVPCLCDVADVRAAETVEYFSHSRLDGSSFSTAIDTSIVPFEFAAENLAAGSSTALDTFSQWKNSPGHWAAIINPDITHMGIGVVYAEDSDYGFYWQQTFVKINKEFADQYIPTENEIVPQADGDINGDGTVNAFDYIVLTEYITKKKNNIPVYFNDAQLKAADCFKDGIISESDAKVLVRYILGEYKSLPYIF